jgi:hypothetical protein
VLARRVASLIRRRAREPPSAAPAGVSSRLPGPGIASRSVRTELDSFRITVAGELARSSTTIGTVGAYVVVVATTVPDHVAGVTSCYLGYVGDAIAASHLRLGPAGNEQLRVEILERPPHVDQHARACLLDHAAELQRALADLTGADVSIDVSPRALERAVEAWEPPASH